MICQGIVCETQIGFNDIERDIKQKLIIDFEASVKPIAKQDYDKIEARQIDYFDAYNNIKKLLNDKGFKLIESVAGEVALLLLAQFPITKVRVNVTKFPMDMPDIKNVTYSCEKQRAL